MSSQPRRLLVVTGSFAHGGAERVAATLLRHFDRSRYKPSVCVMRKEVQYQVPADIPIVTLDKRRKWHYPRAIRRMRAFVRQWRPDVILSMIADVNLFTAWAMSARSSPSNSPWPPWLARIGAAPSFDTFQTRCFAGIAYKGAARVVANSHGSVEDFRQQYPGVTTPISVIHNPVDLVELDNQAGAANNTSTDDPPCVVFCARFVPQKRPDVALAAFAELRAKMPARLLMIGDGPLRSQVEADIRRLKLSNDVELLGHRPNPHPEMQRADLFLTTSDFEGLPNSLIEAQVLGLPAVATACPFGPDEIIEDGRSGRLTPVGDAAAVAAAMSEILGDHELRANMSQQARCLAQERFAAPAITRRYEQLFDEVISERGTA